MTRRWAFVLLLGSLSGGITAAQSSSEQSKENVQTQEPPEEDVAYAPKEYSFNPLQAEKELKVGNFYFKKGSFKAASSRFLEATRWNPGFAEAFRRLGEARDRLKDDEGARQAYKKFIELAPDDKEADSVRKRLEQLARASAK
ncbi:MAG TPA: hypothetical protein VFQ79_02300 [Bryobacteraceae bacterium]|nr:hypothetical protein [Bryobacteraceae bacterium]